MNRSTPDREPFQPPVTLKTLAARLGVSVGTVSNAYNRPEKVSPALRARVLELAAELGYPGPDPAAAALRRGRAGVVGIVFPEALDYAFRDPGVVAFLRGLATVFERAGLGVLLVPAAPGTDADPAPVRAALVDGFVLFSLPDDHALLAAALARRLPTVVQAGPRRADVAFVGVDDRAGARAAAEHVLALGHRRVGVVAFRAADDDAARGGSYRVTRERRAGYEDAARAAGVALAVETRPRNERAAGAASAHVLLARPEPPTAVLAMSDELALGVTAAAAERGLRVPEDLSVVGFDDAGPAAAAGLTTVAQDLEGQGTRAGELLLGAEAWGDAPPHVVLPATLAVRATTAPPAA